MSRLLKASGEEIQVFPANGKTFTWEELERYVEGYLYPYGLSIKGELFWIIANEKNETEDQPDLPYNAQASNLFSPFPEEMRQVFYGDVVVAPHSQWSDALYIEYREKLAAEEYDPEAEEEDNDMIYSDEFEDYL